MPNISLVEKDEVASTSANKEDKLCKICKIIEWKYTCPRCNINYCTVACYQSESHGTCSEAFYRECILEEMGAEVGNPESERKMMEILLRMQKEPTMEQLESDDEDVEPDLADRLESVNLDDADAIWEKLTDAERQEFEQLVQSGDASELLPPWTPWWEFKVEKRLVVDMDEKTDEEMSYAKNCPKIRKNVKPLSQITRAVPSLLVRNGAVNVVGAYCATARWFNGVHGESAAEAASAMVALSGRLADGRNYDTLELALADIGHRALDCPWLGFTAESRQTLHADVGAVLAGPEPGRAGFYLDACLSDVRAVFAAARKPAKPAASEPGVGPFAKRFRPSAELSPLPASEAGACVRKVDYLLSWALAGRPEVCGDGVLAALQEAELLHG